MSIGNNRGCLLAALILVLCHGCVTEAPRAQTAEEFYENEQYDRAHAAWEQRVHREDPEAAFRLGEMYAHGVGVERSAHRAADYYALAVQGDHPVAKLRLGHAYLRGRGVPKDSEMGIALLRDAKEQGNSDAQFALGWLFLEGSLVPQDCGAALNEVLSLAQDGHDEAQILLGRMFLRGRCVPPCPECGAGWLECAADQGHTGAQETLALLYRDGVGVPQDEIAWIMWTVLAYPDADTTSLAPAKLQEALDRIDQWKLGVPERAGGVCDAPTR